MGAQVTGFVNFGAFPGKDRATATVTGQTGIVAGSAVEAWANYDAALSDVHSEDELLMLTGYVRFSAPKSGITAGTGFTVVAMCDNDNMWGRIPFNAVWR
jgi:hypothetical protein